MLVRMAIYFHLHANLFHFSRSLDVQEFLHPAELGTSKIREQV